jgi:zinc ribbon protein
MATASYCPKCGAPSRAGDVFCRSCGNRLGESAAPAQAAPLQPPTVSAPGAAPYSPPGAPTAPPPPPSVSAPPAAPYPGYQTGAPTQPLPLPSQAQPGYQPSYQPPPAPARAAATSKLRPLPLIGALGVALASFLPWVEFPGFGEAATGFDVPFGFLFDPTTVDPGGFDLGLLTLLIGIGGSVLIFMRKKPGIRRLLGVGAAGIGVLYALQLTSLISQAGAGISVTDVMGFGVYVTIGGGVLLAAGKQ